MNFNEIWNRWPDAAAFSGVFSCSDERGIIFDRYRGFRHKSEELTNNRDTAFGIASGTKLFTGLAVCKLIEKKKLSLEDRLCDILPFDLGQINQSVTVFHLLTHTSGVGDHIDEEAPNSMEQLASLYRRYPVNLWENLAYCLPMITALPPKFKPGERFGYSNAGFVLLGLVIEAVSGVSYQEFVRREIIEVCELKHTGFYRMDALPANTALGYISDENGNWRANIFHIPVLGGSDGGLFTCAGDLDTIWRAVFSGKILSEDMLSAFCQVQIARDAENSYGLGVYRRERGGHLVYYAVGGDFGVDFFTAYFPKQKIVASALGNTEINTYPLLRTLIASLDTI